MCAGAMVLARLDRVCFGANDPKTGAAGSVINLLQKKELNHKVEIAGGICAQECGSIMSEFFKNKRIKSMISAN